MGEQSKSKREKLNKGGKLLLSSTISLGECEHLYTEITFKPHSHSDFPIIPTFLASLEFFFLYFIGRKLSGVMGVGWGNKAFHQAVLAEDLNKDLFVHYKH
jgi:hypothetical protein